MQHQYSQIGNLVLAGQGAFLSEAKTDNVGKPQCKSGASLHTNLLFRVVCHSLSLVFCLTRLFFKKKDLLIGTGLSTRNNKFFDPEKFSVSALLIYYYQVLYEYVRCLVTLLTI